jgi:hypothetical protein
MTADLQSRPQIAVRCAATEAGAVGAGAVATPALGSLMRVRDRFALSRRGMTKGED